MITSDNSSASCWVTTKTLSRSLWTSFLALLSCTIVEEDIRLNNIGSTYFTWQHVLILILPRNKNTWLWKWPQWCTTLLKVNWALSPHVSYLTTMITNTDILKALSRMKFPTRLTLRKEDGLIIWLVDRKCKAACVG